MKSIFLAIVLSFVMQPVSAGIFGDGQPTKEFLKKNISCDYGCLAFSVEDFLRYGIKPGAKVTWEKDGSHWLVKIVVNDKVSNSSANINILFSPETATANVSRVNINGDEMRSGMIPSFITPIGEEVYRKTGREKLLIAEIPPINDSPGNGDSSAPRAKKEKNLPKKPKVAIDAEIRLKQQQVQQEELAAKAKVLGDTIKSAVGLYKNSMAEVGDEFSFHMNEGNMFASYKNKKCEFKDKELNFPTIANPEALETKIKDTECELSFRFSTLSGAKVVNVNEGGSCKKFCSYSDGRSLAGRFHK